MEILIRTSVVLLAAWAATRLLGRASAATRHLVWHAALVAIVVAPLAGAAGLGFSVPGWPGEAVTAVADRTRAELGVALMPSAAPATPARAGASAAAPTPPAPDAPAVPWRGIWLLGTVLCLAWFAASWRAAARLARRAQLPPATWQLEAADTAARLGLKGEVRVLLMDREASPLVVGAFRPRVLLPPSARVWDADRRRAVLLHELAHVRRGDCRVQALAHVATALYWFNPLVWMAARALRRERERACDDEVLRRGVRPSSYAAHLLDLARELPPPMAASAALAMARPSELEGRLLAVLADRRARAASRRARLVVPIAAGLASVAVLGAQPVREVRQVEAAPDPQVVRAAATARSAQDEAAIRARVERSASLLASDPSAQVRERAAIDLADAGREEALPALIAALGDDSSQVREKVAIALGLFSNPDVIEPLLRALADEDSQVREKAAMGLAFRRDPLVVDALIQVLGTEPDAQVREKAAMALGTSGDPRARPALEAAIRDADAQVREKAVAALTLLDQGGTGKDAEQIRKNLRDLVGALVRVMP